MKRLTKRTNEGVLLSEENEERYTFIELIDILLERLAAYEDTGLEPEYILELLDDANAMHAELERHKEAGRIGIPRTEGRLMVKCCEEKGCIANVGGQCKVAGCRGAIVSIEGHPHANTADAAKDYDLACHLFDGFRREKEAHHD